MVKGAHITGILVFTHPARWQIDTLIKVMCLGGNFVKEQQREKFCRVVAATPELHSYTVIKLYFNMKDRVPIPFPLDYSLFVLVLITDQRIKFVDVITRSLRK